MWDVLGALGLLCLAVAAWLAFGVPAGVAALGGALVFASVDGRRS